MQNLEARAKSLRDQEGVDVRYFSVIYELVDETRDMLSKMLAPEVRESVLGAGASTGDLRIAKVWSDCWLLGSGWHGDAQQACSPSAG